MKRLMPLGKVLRRRDGNPRVQAAMVDKAPEKTSDQPVFVLGYCGCGNIITPRAQKLQEDDSAAKKMCFNCLLHHRKIGIVERQKDGWSSNNPLVDI